MRTHKPKSLSPRFEAEGLNKRMKKGTAFISSHYSCVWPDQLLAAPRGGPSTALIQLTVYVYKTGILSTLAHNHEIEAPIESGEVKDSESSSVELRVEFKQASRFGHRSF